MNGLRPTKRRPARCSQRAGITRPPIAAILAQCPDHSLGVTIDDGQQHPGCPIGNAPALFPFLNSPHIETEAIGELLPAQPQPLAERDNPAGGGIVDDPTRQTRLAANMGQNLAQSRFDLTSEVGAFHRHQTRQRLAVRRGQILAIRLRISRQQIDDVGASLIEDGANAPSLPTTGTGPSQLTDASGAPDDRCCIGGSHDRVNWFVEIWYNRITVLYLFFDGTQIKRYGDRLGHRDSRIGEKSW